MNHVSIRRRLFATAAASPLILAAACSSSSSGGTPAGQGSPPTQKGAVTTAAGGANPAGAASGACQPDYVMSFCEHISITGAVAVSGTAEGIPETDLDRVDATCSTWVGRKPESSDYPQLRAPQVHLGGHDLQTQWKLPYQAGTVHIDRRSDPTNDPLGLVEAAELTVDHTNYDVSDSASTEPISHATATITVNSDGSGSVVFANLINIDSKKTISGSISWTCVNPK